MVAAVYTFSSNSLCLSRAVLHRSVFTMKLKPGCARAYRDRHRDIWPDLAALLRNAGIRRYGIYLDEQTGTLFATMEIDELSAKNQLPLNPVMRKWWAHMADLMETNPDNSPVTQELPEMFYLD